MVNSKLKLIIPILAVVIIAFILMQVLGETISINTSVGGKVKNLSNVLAQKDIGKIDSYFTPYTQFIYQGRKIDYRIVRNNLVAALSENKVEVLPTSIYVDKYEYQDNKVSNAILIGWIKVNGKGTTELNIKAKFKKVGLFKWDVIELESNDKVFGYLFIDKGINIE